MKMSVQRAGLLVGLCVSGVAANAGTLTVEHADHALSGGITAGYFYSTNTGSSDTDDYQVSDFLVSLSGKLAPGGVGYNASFGSLQAITVLDGGVDTDPHRLTAYSDFGMQYGWVSVAPVEGLVVDAGKLATNVGYEVTPSFANPHIAIAGLWGGQPVYYPGLRATYTVGGVNVYAEANDDSLTLNSASARMARAIGVSGDAGGVHFMASYYNYLGAKDMVDIILSGSVGGVDVAMNLDYHILDDAAKISGADDNAYGVAFYVKPKSGKMSYPVRVEYLSDGTSGVYGGIDSGYTLTVTPTYHATENTFVRAEVSYVSTDKAVLFADEDGVAKDNKTSFALQAGVLF